MKKTCFLLVLTLALITLAACSSAPHKQLNGTWRSKIMNVTIDFDAEKYSGMALGQTFDKSLTLVSENENGVVFLAGDREITAQFQLDNDHILLTAVGGLPVPLVRAN